MVTYSGGYSSPRSGPCAACNQPYVLYGSHWKSPLIVADFAFICISVAIVLGCLFSSRSYTQWRAARGHIVKKGSLSYIFAAFFTLAQLVLYLTTIALTERQTTVKLSYLLVPQVFTPAFYYIGIIFIWLIMATFVEDSLPTIQGRFSTTKIAFTSLLSLLAIGSMVFHITSIAYGLSLVSARVPFMGIAYAFSLTFHIIYTIAVLGLLAVYIPHHRVYNSKAYAALMFKTLTFLLIVTVLQLTIAVIVVIAYFGLRGYPNAIRTEYFFYVADMLINLFTAFILFLFLCLALVGRRLAGSGGHSSSVPKQEGPIYGA